MRQSFTLRLIGLLLTTGTIFSTPLRARGQAASGSGHQVGHDSAEIWGEGMDGLQPVFFVNRYGDEWRIDIEYSARTNYGPNSWLLPTNRAISKLELWQTNGVPITSKNVDVLAALHPPAQTTVSNIFNHFHPVNLRGSRWLRTTPGSLAGAAGFDLGWAFGVSATNDYVLRITPLVYRPDTNLVNAHSGLAFGPKRLLQSPKAAVEERMGLIEPMVVRLRVGAGSVAGASMAVSFYAVNVKVFVGCSRL
jgi:hypothetical protein